MTARARAGLAALAAAATVSATDAPPAAAGESPAAGPTAPAPAPGAPAFPWRFELKHLMTDRGSTEERTRTTVRAEKLLDAPVALLRVDLPYVDKRNDFTSDPRDAGLGDLKGRVGFRALPAGPAQLTTYVDVVLPTASPASLGGGKVQVAPGLTASVPLGAPWSRPGRRARLAPKVQQYVSVAGDPDREDVSYTSTELKLEGQWASGLVLSVNPKPVIDWTAGPDTAAVVEVEAAWIVSTTWRLWVKPGTRLWGPQLPATYDRQVEAGVRLTL